MLLLLKKRAGIANIYFVLLFCQIHPLELFHLIFPISAFFFFLEQKKEQVAVFIHSCSHIHYTNFELCSKNSQKTEEQDKK